MKDSRPIAIYTRISLDRDEQSESPDRQAEICTNMLRGKGLPIGKVFTDRDRSAYKKVSRPAFDEMMRGIRDGVFGGIAVWKLDRLTRRFTETGRLLEALQAVDAQLFSCLDSFDTTTPTGKALLGFVIAQAETESENTSIRVRAAFDAQARAGKPHVGGSRCFGFNRDYTHRQPEALTGERIVQDFLRGVSLNQIARNLNDEGIKTASGKLWYASTVKQWLRSPRIAGLRGHNGTLVTGTWEPLIDERTWIRVGEALDRNKRPANRRSETSHLLTGLLLCGRCGSKLRGASFWMSNGKRLLRYQCMNMPGYEACGRLAISKAPLDTMVIDEAISLLARGQAPTDEGRSEAEIIRLIEEDKRTMEGLTRDAYVRRTIDRSALHRLLAEVEESVVAKEEALKRLRLSDPAPQLPAGPGELLAWFETASVADARSAVRLVIQSVVANPAKTRGGNKFDRTRVEITPRQ